MSTADARLLVFGPGDATMDTFRVNELPRLLEPGDLLVVNDAATLPASLPGRTASGSVVELRLLALRGSDACERTAVLFGDGDFHTPTEYRPAPPAIAVGDRIFIGDGLTVRIESISRLSGRLVDIRFECDGADFWRLLYAFGHPVQYAHTLSSLRAVGCSNCLRITSVGRRNAFGRVPPRAIDPA